MTRALQIIRARLATRRRYPSDIASGQIRGHEPLMTIYRHGFTALMALTFATVANGQGRGDQPVTEADLRPHIAELSSDRYGGRRPGTEGETLTAHYIATHLARAGFVAGGEGAQGWYAPVPLLELTPRTWTLAATLADGSTASFGEDIVLRAPRGEGRIDGGQPVYVGHGIGADGRVPEGVSGRIVLMLASERDGAAVQGLRARRDLLIEAGAAAVLVIADTPAPFEAFRRSFSSGAIQLGQPLTRLTIDGLLSEETGARLLDAGGISPTQAGMLADGPARALPLNLRLTLAASSTAHAYNSYNVVARLPGRVPGSGAILLTGHWDHLGQCRPEGAADRICNGAVDNASGMAVLIEVAERLAAGERPDRDVWIVGTTAEESGLLGAHWFAANPPMALSSITAVLNIDTVAIAPRGAPIAIVGRGTSNLDAEVRAVAASLGRAMVEDDAANAFIRRQDGWAFTQRGVRSIMAGGSFADPALLQAFLAGPYHQPQDELTDGTPLGGAAEDADLHVSLTRRLGSLRQFPDRPPQP